MKLLILTNLLLTPLTEMHAAPVTVKPNMAQVTLDNTQPLDKQRADNHCAYEWQPDSEPPSIST